jgi:hypothetical protein
MAAKAEIQASSQDKRGATICREIVQQIETMLRCNRSYTRMPYYAEQYHNDAASADRRNPANHG